MKKKKKRTRRINWEKGKKREKKRSNSCNMVAHTRWSGTL